MSKGAMNLQDSFLNQVRRENSEVRVLLVNGTVLRGSVKGFDNFTLILTNRQGQHLIYKHAIAQIVNQRPAAHKPDELHVPGFDGTESNSSTLESGSADGESDDHTSEAHSFESSEPGEPVPAAVGADAGAGATSRHAQQPNRSREHRPQRDSHGSDRKHHGGPSSGSGSSDSRGGQAARNPKPRKEGFNTLDLSNVKLGVNSDTDKS